MLTAAYNMHCMYFNTLEEITEIETLKICKNVFDINYNSLYVNDIKRIVSSKGVSNPLVFSRILLKE